MSEKTEPARCRAWRTGPKVGRNVVAWRAQCRRMTTDPSGLCPSHRPARAAKPTEETP